ncbi:MAG: DUF1045 domain-containing protein [Xanthobacteraceae bacterium]
MTGQGARYAVYFVPAAESELYRFGSSVLGYDCYRNEEIPLPDQFGLDSNAWRKLTEEPRRYGFHATLKAPFRLAPSCTETQLVGAFRSFAGLGQSIARVETEIRMLSDFAAIVPYETSAALETLANQCTTIFDAFRAPMSAQERARRGASGLSPSQLQHLDRWGYPYVFTDYRFHMTLAAKIPVEHRDQVLDALRTAYRQACRDQPLILDRISLLTQDNEHARFRMLCQAALKGGRETASLTQAPYGGAR